VLALGQGACFSPEVLAAWRRLEGGFAWSHTVDRERLVQLIEAARRKMTEPTSPFPTGYAERWQRRYSFGAHRFGLIQRRRQAAVHGIAARLAAVVRECALTAWLFLRLRPWDLLPVAQRRLRNIFTTSLPSSR
jgi:hypothetical protein